MQIMDGLNSAINNSHAPRTFNVIKGVSNPKYLRDLKIGNDFDDFAYGSYSTSEFVARKYASKNPNGTLVYLIQTLHKGDNVLYIDEDEKEWLVPSLANYVIYDIREIPPQKTRSSFFDRPAKIYYLRRTN